MLVSDRFREVRKVLKLTQKEMGEKLNKTYIMIQNYETGRRQITDGVLLNLQEKFNINIEWMRTGEGCMFINDKQDKNTAKVQIKNIIDTNMSNCVTVPFYTDIEASAGYGCFTGMEEYENVAVSKSIVKVNDYAVIITVTGDSMEPTLYNKDRVIIDTNDKYELKKNKIYVINKDGLLYIKRYNACINGMYIFTSDNTKYESLVINEDDNGSIVGRLKSVIRDLN